MIKSKIKIKNASHGPTRRSTLSVSLDAQSHIRTPLKESENDTKSWGPGFHHPNETTERIVLVSTGFGTTTGKNERSTDQAVFDQIL